jgi:hypothetical protein
MTSILEIFLIVALMHMEVLTVAPDRFLLCLRPLVALNLPGDAAKLSNAA